jgi:hypothetical protein
MDYSRKEQVEKMRLAFLDVIGTCRQPHEIMAICGCSEKRAEEILAIAARQSEPVGE